jgi:DNA mismatch endonuclease (patch repair protein)
MDRHWTRSPFVEFASSLGKLCLPAGRRRAQLLRPQLSVSSCYPMSVASSSSSAGARSWASSPAVRSVMRGNRKRDTAPELRIRRMLHARGLRYRVATRPLPNRRWTADLVFRGPRVAVFIDGCFWHGCPEHFSVPRTNPAYWGPKIARNQERDAIVDGELESAGWRVVRIWEHEDPATAARLIEEAVRGSELSAPNSLARR